MIRPRSALLVLGASVTLALAACKKPEEAPAPAPSPALTEPSTPAAAAPMAPATTSASVTSVDLGNAVGADNRVATPATTFAPTDTIFASVATRTSEPSGSVPGTLSAKWTYQDGQTVHEDSRQLTLTGDGTTSFQISKPDGLPAGKYKVEIAWDGSVVQTREFEVK